MFKDVLVSYRKYLTDNWLALLPDIIQYDQALAPMFAHHFHTTGKLIRPAITLAFYDQFAHRCVCKEPAPPRHVTQTALAIEILHNATLVHDDLQDGDVCRRGHPTVWKAFDAYQAINTGSALYFHAIRIIGQLDSPLYINRLTSLFANQALNILAGQALEKLLWDSYDNTQHSDLQSKYFEIVERKTSALFALPMMSASILANTDEKITIALSQISQPLGILFQIQDDLLDLFGHKGRDGIGTDIAEGKPSYPVLCALQQASSAEASRLYDIIRQSRAQTSQSDILWAIELIRDSGAIQASLQQIQSLRQQALNAFAHIFPTPHTPTDFLQAICDEIMLPIKHLSVGRDAMPCVSTCSNGW
jgi:geranylgeranyl pyrophosphate synthase